MLMLVEVQLANRTGFTQHTLGEQSFKMKVNQEGVKADTQLLPRSEMLKQGDSSRCLTRLGYLSGGDDHDRNPLISGDAVSWF